MKFDELFKLSFKIIVGDWRRYGLKFKNGHFWEFAIKVCTRTVITLDILKI